MPCYAVLCRAMLCYAVLCRAMPCYAVLCRAMLCCAMLHGAALHCAALRCAALRFATPHDTYQFPTGVTLGRGDLTVGTFKGTQKKFHGGGNSVICVPQGSPQLTCLKGTPS